VVSPAGGTDGTAVRKTRRRSPQTTNWVGYFDVEQVDRGIPHPFKKSPLRFPFGGSKHPRGKPTLLPSRHIGHAQKTLHASERGLPSWCSLVGCAPPFANEAEAASLAASQSRRRTSTRVLNSRHIGDDLEDFDGAGYLRQTSHSQSEAGHKTLCGPGRLLTTIV
jgi:hypothetical protein